ncbi:MAG: chemotaxis protein CheB [Chitinophagaceae bacterium]|jgi:two-component system CheB/CheR fusion protein
MTNNSIEKPSVKNPDKNYVVGIGASAGGLEAINELFDNMPEGTGFSFVVVQHLSPEHKSLMAELLSKHTAMMVFEAKDKMEVKPNSIYLIPPGKIIKLQNGTLSVIEKIRDHLPNTAIDIFLESLANERGDKAIAIILSGTGSDGSKGIRAIKNNGGIVVIQDPATAQFDGMPNSAIATGCSDMILAPEMIAEEILEFVEEAPLLRSLTAMNNQEETIRLDILELVYKVTGHDFTQYKRPTINRRMAKRMLEQGIKSLSDYYKYLTNTPTETRKLCKEFLLHVTKFFRDEDSFTILKSSIIPAILSKKKNGETVKTWTIACSTGEEVYSLAILFDECLEQIKDRNLDVKIFATDISQEVIDIASRGLYTDAQVKNISPSRLKKYFIKEADGFRVIPIIRKMVVFARHDICKDPPFSKIDLLTCRNMLIYMNPQLQKIVLQKIHFSIIDNGYIFLGASENIGVLKDSVSEIDRKWKIYKCVSKDRISDFENPIHLESRSIHNPMLQQVKSKNALNNLNEIFKETLIEEYDYAGILIDKDFEVKQAIGNFKKFLNFPEGAFNFNLLKMVSTDLSIALNSGIRKAIKDNERVVQKNIQIVQNKQERRITIIIKPFLMQKVYLQPFLFIILKEEEIIPRKILDEVGQKEIYPSGIVEEIERELRDTKENLQALIEEVESANEELQSSNEEIVSSNEELQSTNEELQSLNEELHTVNAEHQMKIKELIELNDDLNNYFRNTDIGQILIDKKLIIRKFTPIATKQVNLISTDIGRSIADISNNIKDLDFINSIKSVLQSGKGTEKEINIGDDKIYLMRIAPYLRQNKSVDGVVINFIDVSEVRQLNNILDAVFNSSNSAIIALNAVRDEKGKIVDFETISINNTADKLLKKSELLLKRHFDQLYHDTDTEIFGLYTKVIESGKSSEFEYYHTAKNKWLDIVVVKMMDGLVLTINDITEKKQNAEKIEKSYQKLRKASAEVQETNDKLEQSNMDLMQFASVASHDLKEPLRKIQVFGNMLKEKAKEKLNENEAGNLEKIITSSNRMQILIDDVLTLSRLSKNDTPHIPVDLNIVVNQIIDDLEISIADKKANIRVDPLPKIKGVSGQLHQLFQNLISNAIKFNEGTPEITIKQCANDAGNNSNVDMNNYYCISVKDNGIGFDEQFSEKIFGVFQRLEKTNYQGTGIGLAIVKKIIDNHKGYIKAISAPGKGSEFILILPK